MLHGKEAPAWIAWDSPSGGLMSAASGSARFLSHSCVGKEEAYSGQARFGDFFTVMACWMAKTHIILETVCAFTFEESYSAAMLFDAAVASLLLASLQFDRAAFS